MSYAFTITKSKFPIVIFAILYGLLFSALPVDIFDDRANYLVYAESSKIIFNRYVSSGFFSVVANEPAWLGLNIVLGSFLPAENVVRVIIFFSAFVTSYVVLSKYPKSFVLIILFLFLPQVFKNNVIHLRQGLAISFFLLGFFSSSRFVKVLLLCLTPFIHSSFVFIMLLIFLTFIMKKVKLAADLRFLSIVCVGLAASVGLAYVSNLIGARQGDMNSYAPSSITGFGFLFWCGILALYFSQGKFFLLHQSYSIAIMVFYLSIYWFIPVSARIFESGLLLVLISGLQLIGVRRTAFVLLFILYFIYQYYIRLSQPLLGFGV